MCEEEVEVRRVSDRVMTLVVIFEEDVLRLIYGYGPQSTKESAGMGIEEEINTRSHG